MVELAAAATDCRVASGTIAALVTRRYFLARTLAVSQVALILAGLGLALNPYLVVSDVQISEAAAPDITLQLSSVAWGLARLCSFHRSTTFSGSSRANAPSSCSIVGGTPCAIH